MKKMYKAMLLVLCAVLLVAGSVMGTLAYLKATTGPVTNTFTVGKVNITLDETDVDAAGSPIPSASPVKENEYKLYPGSEYVKDPKIHVAADSEDCWVFIKLENGLKGIESATRAESDGVAGYNCIEDQILNNDWKLIDATNNIYAFKYVQSKGATVATFTNFEIDSAVTNEKLAQYKDAKVKVTAYAIQAANFDTPEAAWTANGGLTGSFSTDSAD